MAKFKRIDLVAVSEALDPELHYTGPGNRDGFAPYHFGGGRVKRFSTAHRGRAPKADVMPEGANESPYTRFTDGEIKINAT